MSPYTNRRTDQYARIENCARFACEIIRGIKEKCGKDFPLLIKVNALDRLDKKEASVQLTLTSLLLLPLAGESRRR